MRSVTQEQHYTISPDSILQSIAEGRQDTFIPSDTESEMLESSQQNGVTWHQSDFLQVAEALHEQVWNEPLDEWKINFEIFSAQCDQVGKGFWSASFSFFKEARTSQGISRIEHQIDIYPTWKFINVWEYNYEPSLLGPSWNSVERNEIKISADDALKIAEQNGGAEEHMSVNNTCEISVMLSPNSVDYHGWHIMYKPGSYSISVDPATAETITSR